MPKGAHPAISPPLLAVLAEMGHGDEIATVDGDLPNATGEPRWWGCIQRRKGVFPP